AGCGENPTTENTGIAREPLFRSLRLLVIAGGQRPAAPHFTFYGRTIYEGRTVRCSIRFLARHAGDHLRAPGRVRSGRPRLAASVGHAGKQRADERVRSGRPRDRKSVV